MSQEIMQQAYDQIYTTIVAWDENGGKRSRRELTRRIVALLNSEHITDGTPCWCDPITELAKPEQEPVAWLPKWAHDRLTGQLGSVSDPITWGINTHIYAESTPETVPIYTAPPRKPWQGLTDDEIANVYVEWDITNGASFADFARSIELLLKKKNHG